MAKAKTKKAKTVRVTARRRTGLRKPLNYLKVWGDPDWTRRLTPRLSVGMVDENLPYGREGGHKSWYLALTQDRDLAEELGPVRGLPKKGKTLLLFEDDVVALVQHLFSAYLVDFDEDGRAINQRAVEDAESWADLVQSKGSAAAALRWLHDHGDRYEATVAAYAAQSTKPRRKGKR